MALLRHRHLSTLLTAFTFLLFLSSSVTTFSLHGNGFSERNDGERRRALRVFDRVLSQKRLSGPGSSPPTCRSKCGKCSPCKPVHVPIQPGFSIPLEYYPEAWRCKCGNKLFMP
ncbi:EPIDERMAL PATTERNING FACTOR-like protein 4 [Manihot esculenta]|uniref:Uncharacterized protein n=2 Tax=Manihot esculenta TaxID=3983 RepID=A0ACB7G938_MANES|nr:EPIDERMAL PATTERNING FACTOR-like protein 4 [Manihot esculenta]KAG8636747.1 hypothetical protein MANES_15G032700v8 [Manihot esculenta]OAY27998.1 hypothetical protein MANES_15G032700v8 [Manihot esculenta]